MTVSELVELLYLLAGNTEQRSTALKQLGENDLPPISQTLSDSRLRGINIHDLYYHVRMYKTYNRANFVDKFRYRDESAQNLISDAKAWLFRSKARV